MPAKGARLECELSVYQIRNFTRRVKSRKRYTTPDRERTKSQDSGYLAPLTGLYAELCTAAEFPRSLDTGSRVSEKVKDRKPGFREDHPSRQLVNEERAT